MIQKVLAEIRKHGNSGKHLSGGERSMLSGFQEAAQDVKDKDENALVPFHLFTIQFTHSSKAPSDGLSTAARLRQTITMDLSSRMSVF